MKKSKKIMFGIAVAAVASLNVKIANNIQERNNAMSLVNLENITEAQETSTSGNESTIYTGVNESYGSEGAVSCIEYKYGKIYRVVYCTGGNPYSPCSFNMNGRKYVGNGDKSDILYH